MSSGRRRRRWPWAVVTAVLILAGAFYLGGGWYFSTQIYNDALAAAPYDPSGLWGGTVQSVRGDGRAATVQILADAEHRDDARYDNAVMGLLLGDGSVVVTGAAVRRPDGSQVRPVLDAVGTMPAAGDGYRLSSAVWPSPAAAGLPAQDVVVSGPDGGYPAWVIPSGDTTRWAVLIHGQGGDRQDMLRMARPVHAVGFTVLAVTVAGDTGAPPAGDGMLGYGATEWDEVQAAVQYALDRGARTLVLGGQSHGGAVALGFLKSSPLAGRVDGLILDAPVSSLADVVDEAAEARELPVVGLPIPESLERAALRIASLRFGVDFDQIDYTDAQGLINVPLLTFQGSADQRVRPAVNDRFMTQGSGAGGTYVVVAGADHPMSWNVQPSAYEARVGKFLAALSRSRP